MEATANRYLTEKCKIFHSTEFSQLEWEWLKEKPEWFDRHLTMIKNKIIIEGAEWKDYRTILELCRKNFNDFWYILEEEDGFSMSKKTITIYALDKDEMLKLKLTIEKQ